MTIEAAAAMGFKSDAAERSMAMLAAAARPDDFDVAMDLARFVRIPLEDATEALIVGGRRLCRLGFADGADVRSEVAGMAEAYSHTWYGQLDIFDVKAGPAGAEFVAELKRAAARLFGGIGH